MHRTCALVPGDELDGVARLPAHDPFDLAAVVGDMIIRPERNAGVLVRLALELAEHGINVNAVAPGAMAASRSPDMLRTWIAPETVKPRLMAIRVTIGSIALRRAWSRMIRKVDSPFALAVRM